MDTVLCSECRSFQPFYLIEEKTERECNGVMYPFHKIVAICKTCSSKVYYPGLHDLNEANFDREWRRANDYILIDEIEAILDKYSIDAPTLSKQLGFEEDAIDNYLEGQLPSRHNSDVLKRAFYNS